MSSPAESDAGPPLMQRAPSLERQLNIGIGLALALLLLVAAILICVTLRALAEQYVTERLRHDLETLIAVTTLTDERQGVAAEQLASLQLPAGRYYYISRGDRSLRSRSLENLDFDLPKLASGQEWDGMRTGPDNQELLIVAQAARIDGQAGVVALAEDVSQLEANLHRLTLAVGALAMFALVGLLWLQRVLIRRSLRPLHQLQDQLRQMERGERHTLPIEGVPQEILPLVDRLNSLLALLSARLERSRKAAGNLAHALKTPLAVLTQLADDPATGACRSQLSEQLFFIRSTVDRELRRARLAGGTLSGHFDLHEALEALLDTLTRIYREKSLRLRVDCAPGAQFAGDREDFLELMGVLLDNAFKWANHTIHIRVSAGTELGIGIEDDGPGIEASQRDRLLARGQRLDESPTGAGLGLAIASDIVEQYQGQLMLGEAQLGGLAVSLRLPGRPG